VGAFVTVAEGVFYLLSLVAILAALGVVTVPNIVHAALFLILALAAVAGFYVLLATEFLALVQILVYAGAVAILILFGLMLTRGGQDMPSVGPGGQWPIALVAAGVLLVALFTAVLDTTWPRDAGEVTIVSMNALATALFNDWLLPFLLIALVLDVALSGAIILSQQEEDEA
jgi:NADH-quinone oxidoreductase subunit J